MLDDNDKQAMFDTSEEITRLLVHLAKTRGYSATAAGAMMAIAVMARNGNATREDFIGAAEIVWEKTKVLEGKVGKREAQQVH